MGNDNSAIFGFALAAGVLVFLLTPVAAQVSGSTAAEPCSPAERLQRRDLQPNTQLSPGEPLDEKLARTDGVLCPPPGIDPELSRPPTEGGAIKIIPPPGAPGGNPAVRPR
jgi:hypothetical protein